MTIITAVRTATTTMLEFDALHATSLILVGKKPQSSSPTSVLYSNYKAKKSSSIHINKAKNDNEEKMSLSKMTMTMTTKGKRQQQQQSIVTDLSGPVDERWRIHGRSRRKQILEDDKSKGGRDFSLSFDCSVQRYFSVAHWYVPYDQCKHIICGVCVCVCRERHSSTKEDEKCIVVEYCSIDNLSLTHYVYILYGSNFVFRSKSLVHICCLYVFIITINT